MNKAIPKIYIITTGDKQRMNRVEKALNNLDFEYVYSNNMEELKILEKKYRKRSHKFRQKAIMAGEIGAFNTHSKAWKLIVDSNQAGVIIEDNIDFLIEPSELFNQNVINLIYNCGLISFTDFRYKLYHDRPFIISSIKEKKPLPIICYGVSPERAENLLHSMKKTAYCLPIDKWLSIPKLCGINCFVNHISYAKRQKTLSSIANQKKGKKSFNLINIFFWGINKIKYNY